MIRGRRFGRGSLIWGTAAVAGLFSSGLGCGDNGSGAVSVDAHLPDGGMNAVDANKTNADSGVDANSGPPISYTFDTDMQGFGFDRYQDPTPGATRNLASFQPPPPPLGTVVDGGGTPATTPDGGVADDGGTPPPPPPPPGDAGISTAGMPTLEFDGQNGNPAPGSLKVTVPFTDFNQVVDVGFRFDPSMQPNWSGKTLHVKVRLASGTFSGGAVLYVLTTSPSSPTYLYAASGWTLLLSSDWHDITLNLGQVASANQVIGFGVQFGTGGAATPGMTFNAGMPVFNVDTFTDHP